MKHAMSAPHPSLPIRADQTLGELAAAWASASRIFQKYGLDFCCGGQQSLAAACARRGLDPDAVLGELNAIAATAPAAVRWEQRPAAELIAFILDRFHEGHRAELPRLVQMARKVEAVHRDKAGCPKGLAQHLEHVARELEEHMQKEEQVLFPRLLAGDPRLHVPIEVLTEEHVEHGRNLARLRELGRDYQPPVDACGTWRALYLGMAEFEREVMEHIHLENHVLFPSAIDGR